VFHDIHSPCNMDSEIDGCIEIKPDQEPIAKETGKVLHFLCFLKLV